MEPDRPTEPERFQLTRGVTIMEPSDDPAEAWGVLNPAAARAPDGQLYLFPRLVSAGNYSRIGIARVLFDGDGNATGVARAGIALEPAESYEKNPITGGGCEDARVTHVPALGGYVMTYTAYSEVGPRVALALSEDLLTWRRLGLVHFASSRAVDLSTADDKDALIFPTDIVDPSTGRPSIGLLHRPTLGRSPLDSGLDPWWTRDAGNATEHPAQPALRLKHPSIWLSYANLPASTDNMVFRSSRRVMSPRRSWEHVKIGAGTPPIATAHGWLVLYHGVAHRAGHFRYSAGAMVLDAQSPERVLYRSPSPILTPGHADQLGTVPDVVFPTGVDRRFDLGQPNRVDVYYGSADSRIGVATMTLPDTLD